MKQAVFLDRDGTINELVQDPATGEYGPPHVPEDLVVYPYVIESLLSLQTAGFEIFLVSNQPDYAKGKTSLMNIQSVHAKLDRFLKSEGIHFRAYYYCYHHLKGIVPGYSFECECKKPKPYFVLKAAEDYGIDLGHSWMIGDRDTDMECGKSAGTKTILIEEPHSSGSRGSSRPDFKTANLKDAVLLIVSQNSACGM
jgi:D-glycero-D-manno-heptose 1,7-bisphosphate phosphatase